MQWLTASLRGAGDSAGRTTWTGKAELQDFVSVVGLIVYYLQHLSQSSSKPRSTPQSSAGPIPLLLGGYSYGSLILARIPPTPTILHRFSTAALGTSAAEILLRARTLAKQTLQAAALTTDYQTPTSPRGRSLHPEHSPTGSPSKRASPMTVGGEETDPAARRRSRDARRSADVIRRSVEAPRRLRAHIKHRHVGREQSGDEGDETPPMPKNPGGEMASGVPEVSTSYLFISPVLVPFRSALLPPGAPTAGFAFGKGEASASRQYLRHPTLVLFGSHDAFTASKRLGQWAERQAAESQAEFRWSEIDGAGHFWSEAGVMKALQRRVVEWMGEVDDRGPSKRAAG